MGKRGFPRVDHRDAWEPEGGEGRTWVKATRSSGTRTWVCVCAWQGGGCGLGPGSGGTGVSDQRVDVYSVDSTGSTELPIFERE